MNIIRCPKDLPEPITELDFVRKFVFEMEDSFKSFMDRHQDLSNQTVQRITNKVFTPKLADYFLLLHEHTPNKSKED